MTSEQQAKYLVFTGLGQIGKLVIYFCCAVLAIASHCPKQAIAFGSDYTCIVRRTAPQVAIAHSIPNEGISSGSSPHLKVKRYTDKWTREAD